MNGDATFVGPNSTDDAVITYYQKKRHIFGDLKIEIFDEDGKLLDTVPTSKRRGLNRATWSMRLKPPRVPAAATAAFGAARGPRLLPGTYTVKLTKDKQVYTMQLPVVADPRTKYTADDRRAQLKLSMKLYHQLEDMAYAVERINGMRLALDERAGKLKAGAPLAERLRRASAEVDVFRNKIVATKEGGAITGEERLREFLADLYGNVVGYEGCPSQTQVQRADALAQRTRRSGQVLRRLGDEGTARSEFRHHKGTPGASEAVNARGMGEKNRPEIGPIAQLRYSLGPIWHGEGSR